MNTELVPYQEYSHNIKTQTVDASNSLKVRGLIDYARKIAASEPNASLVFDLANFLEDAVTGKPCSGAFCTHDEAESCELCGFSRDEGHKT